MLNLRLVNIIVETPLANHIFSTSSVRDYDIISDIWNSLARVTVRELLSNETYRTQVIIILNTVDNFQFNNPFYLNNV